MRGGQLTTREAEIIRHLLSEKGITVYDIIELTPEGDDLPGCTYPHEIEELSAKVVTADNIYHFWLDWKDGQYFFVYWDLIPVEQVRKIRVLRQAQQQLCQRLSSS